MNKYPKYSIIIPSRNGCKYLPTCIETIISQNYSDYELIISDDHSTDGTREYLEKLVHPNIQIIYPEEELSMTEHWEWALSHAKGEWQIFLGQDDAVQAYFFQLADRLTKIAKDKNLRAIVARRAYYFWPGCEFEYGNQRVSYSAYNKIQIRYSLIDVCKALFTNYSYHNLPQMYGSSLFHHSLIDEVRRKQRGIVFTCHPQDANLSAISCSLENKYLRCEIPLSWVGTSTQSAGLAISSQDNIGNSKQINKLREEYGNKISNSRLKYNFLAGDFSLGNNSIYFWQALLETHHLRSNIHKNILSAKVFKIFFFAAVLNGLRNTSMPDTKMNIFLDILKVNKIKFMQVKTISHCYNFISFFVSKFNYVTKFHKLFYHRYFSKTVNFRIKKNILDKLDILFINNEISHRVKKIIISR